MEIEQTIYTCDQCGRQVVVYKKVFGVRKDKHWIRLFMTKKGTDMERQGYHFCCKGCVANYMMDDT